MASNNEKKGKEFAEKLAAMEQDVMAEFLARVKQRTPVRTGTLRDGWYVQKVEDGAELLTEVPYAVYVEMGTEKMAPRAMIGTTMLELPQIIADAKHKAGL